MICFVLCVFFLCVFFSRKGSKCCVLGVLLGFILLRVQRVFLCVFCLCSSSYVVVSHIVRRRLLCEVFSNFLAYDAKKRGTRITGRRRRQRRRRRETKKMMWRGGGGGGGGGGAFCAHHNHQNVTPPLVVVLAKIIIALTTRGRRRL